MFILKIVDHDFLNSPNTELDYPQTTADVLDTLILLIQFRGLCCKTSNIFSTNTMCKYSPAIDFRYINATVTYS